MSALLRILHSLRHHYSGPPNETLTIIITIMNGTWIAALKILLLYIATDELCKSDCYIRVYLKTLLAICNCSDL